MIMIFQVSGCKFLGVLSHIIFAIFRRLKSCGFRAIRLQQGRSGGASHAAFPKPDGVKGELLRDLMIQPNCSTSPFLSSFGSQKIEDFKCQLVWDLDFGPASLNGLWTWPLSALSALQLCFSHRGSELGTAVISMTTAVVVKVLNLPDPKSKSKRWGLQPIARFTVDSWFHETMHRSPPGDLRGFSFCLKQKPWQCQNFSAELSWKFDYSVFFTGKLPSKFNKENHCLSRKFI